MKRSTLFFLRDKATNKVLLGIKKRGFAKGKINGFGGKVEPGETVLDAAIRELKEESYIDVSKEHINKVAELTFFHLDKEEWNQIVHVFIADQWAGDPVESEEMKPIWTSIDSIPFDKMWADDRHWLPIILNDHHVKAEFSFKEDGETLDKIVLERHDSLF